MDSLQKGGGKVCIVQGMAGRRLKEVWSERPCEGSKDDIRVNSRHAGLGSVRGKQLEVEDTQ